MRSLRPSILKVGLLALTVPMLFLLGGYFSELSSVNDCLSRQGSFDYVRQLCDLDGEHEFISYFSRHPLRVNGCLLASVFGLLLCAMGLYRGRR